MSSTAPRTPSPAKEPPASIESDKDPRDDARDNDGERRRVGPEDEDRRLRDGEERPAGQVP